MKWWVAISLIFCLTLGLSACTVNHSQDVLSDIAKVDPSYPDSIAFSDFEAVRINCNNNPVQDKSIQAVNQFSYQTAAPILSNFESNGCYSPLSLFYALALASTGANGQTLDELLSLLGFADTATLSGQCGNLYRLLYNENEVTQLKIANSLWLDNDYQGEAVAFKETFIQNALDQFYASLFKVDFAQESTSKAMAQWIADNTNGTLNPTFKANPEQILSIINTIYFRDEWTDLFDASKTQADVFHLSSGSDVTCDFMNRVVSSSEFSKGDGFIRSALRLKSNARMVFVLPDQGINLRDLVASSDQLKEVFEGGQTFSGDVTWKIPKFTCDTKLDLIDTLKTLGVKSAFNPDADFSGITDHMAYISSIIQNTHVAIDEKGVEASAFTKIDYVGSAMPVDHADMILDRPFIYAIYSDTDNLMFIGICANPTEGQ